MRQCLGHKPASPGLSNIYELASHKIFRFTNVVNSLSEIWTDFCMFISEWQLPHMVATPEKINSDYVRAIKTVKPQRLSFSAFQLLLETFRLILFIHHDTVNHPQEV